MLPLEKHQVCAPLNVCRCGLGRCGTSPLGRAARDALLAIAGTDGAWGAVIQWSQSFYLMLWMDASYWSPGLCWPRGPCQAHLWADSGSQMGRMFVGRREKLGPLLEMSAESALDWGSRPDWVSFSLPRWAQESTNLVPEEGGTLPRLHRVRASDWSRGQSWHLPSVSPVPPSGALCLIYRSSKIKKEVISFDVCS